MSFIENSNVVREIENYQRRGYKMASQTVSTIVRIVAMVLGPILRAMTSKIEEELERFLIKFYAKCETTENPLDDLLAGFLLDMLDIPRPE